MVLQEGKTQVKQKLTIMPNWCNTVYVIDGDAQEVNALYDLMKELEGRKKPSIENGFGITWLGCLVDALGEDWHEIHCRGCWEGPELDDGILTFRTQTAWASCNEVFDLVCKKYPSLSYYYQAEEPGIGDYYTNDIAGKYFPERFLVYLCTDDDECITEYFSSLSCAYKWIEDISEQPIQSEHDIQSLEHWWRGINPNAFIHIHEFIMK